MTQCPCCAGRSCNTRQTLDTPGGRIRIPLDETQTKHAAKPSLLVQIQPSFWRNKNGKVLGWVNGCISLLVMFGGDNEGGLGPWLIQLFIGCSAKCLLTPMIKRDDVTVHANIQLDSTAPELTERHRKETGIQKTNGRTCLHNCQTTDNPLVWKSFTVLVQLFWWTHFIPSKPNMAKRPYSNWDRRKQNGGSQVELRRSKIATRKTKRLMLRRFSNYRRIWVIFLSKIREKSHMLTKAAYVVSHCYTKAKDGRRKKKLISNIPYYSSFHLPTALSHSLIL